MTHANCHPDRLAVGRGLCPQCYQREWYFRNRSKIAARYQENKDSIRARAKARYAANPKVAWAANIAAKYGITPEEYSARFKAQHGKCRICLKPSPDEALAVDHDHNLGLVPRFVRGLLCESCNQAIGIFDESPERLRAACAYLQAAEARQRVGGA